MRNIGRDVLLDVENVVHLPVVGLRPEVKTVRRRDQLHGNPQPIAGAPDAAFEHVRYTELAADFAQVFVAIFEIKRRRPPRYFEPADLRDVVDQLFGQAIREIVAVGIVAEAREWQHRKRICGNGRIIDGGRRHGRSAHQFRHGQSDHDEDAEQQPAFDPAAACRR